MQHLRTIIRFGWPYMRRYWVRLCLGLLLGVGFGLSSAVILGASKTLFERLEGRQPAVEAAPIAPLAGTGGASWVRQAREEVQQRLRVAVREWLPEGNQPVSRKQIAGVLVLLPLLFAVRGAIGYASSYCMGWVSERVVNDMRMDVLRKLSSLSLDFFNRSTMGDLLTRINGDTGALQKALNLGISDLVKEPVTVIGILGYLIYLDWRLSGFVMVFLPFCLVPIVVLGRKSRRASTGNVTATVVQSSLLVEFLSSIRVVKAFSLEAQQVKRFQNLCRDLVHYGMKHIQAKELVNPIIETISALGLGLLIVYIFYTGRSLADLVLFLGGVAAIYTPIKKLAKLHVMFQRASVGIGRLEQVMLEEPTVKEPVEPKALKGFAREIRFENVSFAYREEEVLRGIALRLPRGFKLGVAGESGSGKSTLVNLLFRFYDPTSGRITLDGQDIREVASEDLRRLMALVSQEVVVFDTTVAENIACGRIGASMGDIEKAARAAHAHEFICQLPEGYQTRVGERGVTLSGGQRQRLAIARAFIRDAPILVLDEATASLDSQSEAEVQSAIEELSENRTVICVAHRLSTLSGMDGVLVLSRGEVAEQGTFGELIERGGLFAAMARRQGITAAAGSGVGSSMPI